MITAYATCALDEPDELAKIHRYARLGIVETLAAEHGLSPVRGERDGVAYVRVRVDAEDEDLYERLVSLLYRMDSSDLGRMRFAVETEREARMIEELGIPNTIVEIGGAGGGFLRAVATTGPGPKARGKSPGAAKRGGLSYEDWTRAVLATLRITAPNRTTPPEERELPLGEVEKALMEDLADAGEDSGNLPAILDADRVFEEHLGDFTRAAVRLVHALYAPVSPEGTTPEGAATFVGIDHGEGAADVLFVDVEAGPGPGVLVERLFVPLMDLVASDERELAALHAKVASLEHRAR